MKKYRSVEKNLENLILAWLHHKKIFAWKNQSVGIWNAQKKCYFKSNNSFHIRGVSDILGILPDGRLLAIEVKSAKGVLTDFQKDFLEKIKGRNGVAITARSLRDVESALMAVASQCRTRPSVSDA